MRAVRTDRFWPLRAPVGDVRGKGFHHAVGKFVPHPLTGRREHFTVPFEVTSVIRNIEHVWVFLYAHVRAVRGRTPGTIPNCKGRQWDDLA
ncbi:hypothetical protein GCM10020256_53640 [Streptomyces thermocoprophilus]